MERGLTRDFLVFFLLFLLSVLLLCAQCAPASIYSQPVDREQVATRLSSTVRRRLHGVRRTWCFHLHTHGIHHKYEEKQNNFRIKVFPRHFYIYGLENEILHAANEEREKRRARARNRKCCYTPMAASPHGRRFTELGDSKSARAWARWILVRVIAASKSWHSN